jgi:ketosteroid isomerase-like protein
MLKHLLLMVLALSLGAGALALQNDSAQIENTYRAWTEATRDKDLKTWATFLAPGAVFIPPGVPALETEADIVEYYRASFADPGFSLDCSQTSVEVAKSGEMAWSRGRCHATLTDSGGRIATGTSRWFKIWIKQGDGSWKCRFNAWNYQDG